jgi:dTDP-4-dehydrorhamnose 3,5-epimerase
MMGEPRASSPAAKLPAGVSILPLRMHEDERGVFTEIFRRHWDPGLDVVQWNLVRSEAAVLRGVHVHRHHADYLVVASGRATFGLLDLRPGSPTEGLAACCDLGGDALAALVIPPGVAHGFLFHEPSLHVYAVTRYFDPSDELGCRWDDPELGIPWPFAPRLLSERDSALPGLAEVRPRIPPYSV